MLHIPSVDVTFVLALTASWVSLCLCGCQGNTTQTTQIEAERKIVWKDPIQDEFRRKNHQRTTDDKSVVSTSHVIPSASPSITTTVPSKSKYVPFVCQVKLPGSQECAVPDVNKDCCEALRASLGAVAETEDEVDWEAAQYVCGDVQPEFDCGEEQQRPICSVQSEHLGVEVTCDFGELTPHCCAATQIFLGELIDEVNLEPGAQMALACMMDGDIFERLQGFDLNDCKAVHSEADNTAECFLEHESCSLGQISAPCCGAFHEQMHSGDDPDPTVIARSCIHDLDRMRSSACMSSTQEGGLDTALGSAPMGCTMDVTVGNHRLVCNAPKEVVPRCCQAYESYLQSKVGKSRDDADSSFDLVASCGIDDIEVLTGMDTGRSCIAEVVTPHRSKAPCDFKLDAGDVPLSCRLGSVEPPCCSAVKEARALFVSTISMDGVLDDELFASCRHDAEMIGKFLPRTSCDIVDLN